MVTAYFIINFLLRIYHAIGRMDSKQNLTSLVSRVSTVRPTDRTIGCAIDYTIA
jgi:hypothetical protein